MPDNLTETDNVNLMWGNSEAELEEITEEEETIDAVDEDEESEETIEEDDSQEEESETIEFNGREISADDLEEMEKAFNDRKNFQADYTRKTTALSQEMKRAQAHIEKQESITESLEATLAELQESINSDEKEIDWDELAEDDPGEALKLERKFKKRRKEIQEAKAKVDAAKKQATDAKLAEQQQLIVELIPEWFDNGAPTKLQEEEYTVIGKYLLEKGFTNEEITSNFSAKDWPIYRDAAKYAALQKKKPGIKKLVKKKPKTVKGGKTPKQGSKNPQWDKVFYGDSMK